MINDQCSNFNDTASISQSQNTVTKPQAVVTSKFKLNATPFFVPKDKMPKAAGAINQGGNGSESIGENDQSKGALASSLMNSGLDSLTIDNEFTPSTPYVHKFRTELCKTYMLYGKCKFGDEVSNTEHKFLFEHANP